MDSSQKFIPIASPDLSGREEEYATDAIRSSWISSTGPYLERFEREFAELCGATTALGVCNGTVALHLALLTLDVRPGDEVIVPSLTFIATANAVRYVGAEPVFVDVDPKTWCLDPQKIGPAITDRTKGIIAVHLYGHPADMDAINQIAAVHGLWVVEDAAEAQLATYKGRQVGSLASIATFSFYGNKVFTCGQGGALTLSDPELEQRARLLRGQGMDPNRRYFFPVTGYNFHLTNLACALLCAQLERHSEMIDRRRTVYSLYRELLSGIPGITFQPVADWATLSPWLFSIVVDRAGFGISRDKLADELAKESIDTRPFFIPLHRLPPFREEFRERNGSLPVTDHLGECGLNLPTYSMMPDAAVRQVASALRLIHKNAKHIP
jgi:perosamine synthetase